MSSWSGPYRTFTREVRVVDGDTLAVTIDPPPHNKADKKLRLRGINCPDGARQRGDGQHGVLARSEA